MAIMKNTSTSPGLPMGTTAASTTKFTILFPHRTPTAPPQSQIENRKSKIPLPVLQHNPLQRIAHILTSIDRLLDVVVEFLPLKHLQRIGPAAKQLGHGRVMIVIATAFLVVDGDQ